LYELVRSNSNQIWESNLSTVIEHNKSLSKSIKKPTAKDSYATKLNFIRMKYENLVFVARGKYTSIEELNQQLVAAVKTNNYELTLRILAQGADANYKTQEDGNQLLHIAVLNNQIGQIELLSLYGADVTCLNRSGQSPLDLAEQNNYQTIMDRLYELQFELTDELSYFLCNKRPDHKLKKHFLIPNNLLEVTAQDNIKLKLEQVYFIHQLFYVKTIIMKTLFHN
jgi:G protein-coupled receptor kinase interacting protein 2